MIERGDSDVACCGRTPLQFLVGGRQLELPAWSELPAAACAGVNAEQNRAARFFGEVEPQGGVTGKENVINDDLLPAGGCVRDACRCRALVRAGDTSASDPEGGREGGPRIHGAADDGTPRWDGGDSRSG